jgi:hypothetical protein
VTITPNTDDYRDLVIETDAPPQVDEAYEYAMFLKDLRGALEIKESSQWLTGDMLIERKTVYREHTIENIADACGCAASSLYDYRQMAEFYPVDVREKYKAKDLYYSHLRLARRLKTLEDACRFLDECVLNVWSVYGAEQALKARQGIDTPDRLPRLTPALMQQARDYARQRKDNPYGDYAEMEAEMIEQLIQLAVGQ